MDVSLLSIPLVFIAGVLSFLSPCVLPLVPVYLGHLVGTSNIAGQQRSTVMMHALAFVAGFSTIFVTLGALAGVLNSVLPPGYKEMVGQVAGVILIVLGLHVFGIIRIPFLYREARFELKRERSVSYPASYIIGMTFAAGWTPCIGPILGGVLTLAANARNVSVGTVGLAALLLLFYSAGLAVPFLATAAAWQGVSMRMKQMYRYMNLITRVSGVLLVFMGIILLTGSLAILNREAGNNGLLVQLNQFTLDIEHWLTERFAS